MSTENRLNVGDRVRTTHTTLLPKISATPLIVHPDDDTSFPYVEVAAPAPTHGSRWTNGQMIVEVEGRRGLLILYEEAILDDHGKVMRTPPLYAGSVVGAAQWLLECGFEVVEGDDDG